MQNPWPRRALYFVLAGGYYYYLHTRLDTPADIILSIVGGVISAGLIFAVPKHMARSREAKLFLDAMSDVPTLQDGKLSAAAGRIVPVGLPLRTPFQNKECVAYEYQDLQQTPFGAAEYLGFAVMPCAIQTQAGEIRLKGHARIGPFQEEAPFLEEAAKQECLQSLNASEFQDARLPQSEIAQVTAEIAQNPGTVSRNWRRAGAALAGAPVERYVRVGEKVCVIGTYSAAENSMMPKYPMTLDPLRKKLIALNPADVQTAAGGAPLLLVFVLLFVNAALFGGVHLYGRFGRDPMELIMAVESGDVSLVQHLIGRGFDPNAPEREGQTPLYFARKGPVAETLIRAGANVNPPGDKPAGQTPLMRASRDDDRDVVRILLEHGADVKTRGRAPCERTALSFAIRSQNHEVEKMLIDHGAPDDRVTQANGAALPQDGGEPYLVVEKYLLALQAGNAPGMQALRMKCVDDFYSDERLKKWRDSHPIQPEFLSGFSNGKSASLSAVGVNREGKNYRWDYLLTREPNGWIIREEW